MEIDDTFIVPQSMELSIPEGASSKEVSEVLGKAILNAVQQASALVASKHPQHRVFALSASPSIVKINEHQLLTVTAIIAIVPDPMGRKRQQYGARQVALSS